MCMSPLPTMTDILMLKELFSLIAKTKRLERTGWLKHKVPRPIDTTASHTTGAALLGWVRAKEEGLNTDKVVKMLLIHDLMEAVVGDHDSSEVDRQKQTQEENLGFIEMLPKLPEAFRDEAHKLFLEFQKQETKEAILAWECDKLDTLLQALEYGKEVPGIEQEFLRTYKPFFRTPRGKELYAWIKENASKPLE